MTILERLSARGIPARRVSSSSGGEYHGPCPACGGTKRFHVWPEKNDKGGSYWCRDCGKTGDGIAFLREFEGMSFHEACAELGITPATKAPTSSYAAPKPLQMASDRVTAEHRPEPKEHPADVVDVALWREKAGKFTDTAHAELLSNPDRLTWLSARGVPLEVVKRFRLGWTRKQEFRPWPSWGLRDEVKPDGSPRLFVIPEGLVVPCFEGDAVIRLRVRLAHPPADDPGHKYHVVKGSHPATFTAIGEKARAAVIVETELDAMAIAHAAGDVVHAVAIGSAQTKPDGPATSVLRECLKILLALDADEAGVSACRWWVDRFPQAAFWPTPTGKDAGDYAKTGGDLRAWILAGLPPSLRLALAVSPKLSASVPARDARIEAVLKTLPAPVVELYTLLSRWPAVAIEKFGERQEGLRLRYEEAWSRKHWEDFGRISDLSFLNDECRLFIDTHPARVVNRRTFFDG